MPPKKGKKSKGQSLIDGVDTTAMSREQLEAFAHRLKNEMEREREERNYFQMERDKLRTFWEITRQELEESNANTRNKDREVEVAQEMAEVDIKHVIQQMKHLQFENQTRIGELRVEGMTQLKLSQEEHAIQEEELLRDKVQLRRLLREKDETMQLQIQQLKMKHSEMIREKHEKFEKEAKDMIALHEKKLSVQEKETDTKNRMEMFEVEERKNTQIQKLLDLHDSAFNDMKNFYNDITMNNLSLISSLKEEMEELRKYSERHERLANETIAQNKKLVEPLEQTRSELSEVKRKLENYDRDKVQLLRLKRNKTKLQKEIDEIKWETDCLLLRNEAISEERDILKNKFEEAVMEVQQKTGLKSVLLERKLSALETKAEAREALLNEAIVASGMEPPKISIRLDNLIQSKNETIDELKFELARVCKAHDDLVSTYEAKLIKFGIPREELGFEPLKAKSNLIYSTGPAGLVTKNQ